MNSNKAIAIHILRGYRMNAEYFNKPPRGCVSFIARGRRYYIERSFIKYVEEAGYKLV